MKEYQLIKVKNNFPDNSLRDVKKTCQQELKKLTGIIKRNSSIAIGVGSRGIDNLEIIVSETVDFIKVQGGHPFIIPAMGSHGGATAQGQKEVLAGYGITEKNIGAPIRSDMETIEPPRIKCNNHIFMDKLAYESDGIILINKIQPHTDFNAEYESGLAKMAVIGLGKDLGAQAIHDSGVHGLVNLIPSLAKIIFDTGKILAGIALIENAYDKTMMIRAISGNKILEEELGLINIARSYRPELPVNNIDVLLIDRMGKNISGVGMNTHILGRIRIYGQPEPENPDIKSIVVHDLTDQSHGNAIGVGLADIITRNLFNKIDFEKTYKNVATSSFLERGKIPFVAENDLEAFCLALRNCGSIKTGKERIIRIKDTRHLDELYVSDTIFDEIKDNPRIETIGEKVNLFNAVKTLSPF
jgi:hypothetical protein